MKVGKCHMDKNHRKHQTAEIVRIDNGCNLNEKPLPAVKLEYELIT